MKIDDDGKTVLNEREEATYRHFQYLRNLNLDVTEAALQSLTQHGVKPSKEFVSFLSDDTLTLVKGEVVPADQPDGEESDTEHANA